METEKHPLWHSLNQLIEDIEANLRSKTSLDGLTKDCYLSKFHLHRVFRRLSGHSLMHYVRSRKLAESLQDLLGSDLRVADVAQEFGFEHHQSYIRAFKKEFGVTPAEFREGRRSVSVVDPIDTAEWVRFSGGLMTKPRIVVKPAFLLVGVRSWIVQEENRCRQTANAAGVDFFQRERYRIPYTVDPGVYIGLTRVPELDEGGTYYMPSLEVSHLPPELPGGMTAERVAAQKYAVFTYVGMHPPEQVSSATLGELWTYIFSEWMPRTKRGHTERMSFERIDTAQAGPGYCEVELYYPLQRY